MEENTKIFCIGLNKTGTVSLHEAFQKVIPGKSSVHFWMQKYQNSPSQNQIQLKV